MAQDTSDLERTIRTEPRGPHWIAWIPDSSGKPEQSVVLVGLTREEAAERAKRWLEEQRRNS